MSEAIRRAAPGDYESIGLLTVSAYESAGMINSNDAYASTLLDAAGRAAKAEVYVLDGPEGLVGTVTLAESGMPYAEVARPGELEFRMLAVDPAVQGKGLGSELVAFCAAQAAARGLHSLVLCARDINVAAIRLYARLGFDRDPARDLEPVPGVNLLVLKKAV